MTRLDGFDLFNMERNQTSLIESNYSGIKKCCSGKYKKVTKVRCQYL